MAGEAPSWAQAAPTAPDWAKKPDAVDAAAPAWAKSDAPEAKKSSPAMENMSDMGMVYPVVEAAMHAVSGMVGGFPGYLGGGVGGIINRATGQSDELPSETGSKIGKALTYQPVTERGKRLTERAMTPLTELTKLGETAGHKVTDLVSKIPPSPAGPSMSELPAYSLPSMAALAGALTEAGIQMGVPSLLGEAGRGAHEWASGVGADMTGRAGARPAPGAFTPPPKVEVPSKTGTSSGVPLKLDRLIAEAQRIPGMPPPPDVPGAIRDIKRAGPGARQGQLDVPQAPAGVERTPIAQTVQEAAGALERPPAPEAPTPEVALKGEQEPPATKPFDPRKDYAVPPLVIGRSAVRGEKSGGKNRRVYEVVQTNTPFERVLANSGREHETKDARDQAREELVAAVRQMSQEEAQRFGALKRLPPEKLVEAAQQYWASIRTDLHNTRLANPAATTVSIEAPDAERSIFFGKGPLASDVGELKAMLPGAGWAEKGGRLIRSGEGASQAELAAGWGPQTGPVTGRTSWLPKEDWFAGKPPGITEADMKAGVERMEQGLKLTKPQQEAVDYMRSVLDERRQAAEMPPEEEPREEGAPMSDEDALRRYGPGTLGSNPMMDPAVIKDALDSGVKNVAGWANAIQSAPDSAKPAIAPLHEYARTIQAAKETAQRDVLDESPARAQQMQADYSSSMNAALQANPRFQTVTPTTVREAARQIERAKREIGADKLRNWLLDNGYALRRHAEAQPGSQDVFREPSVNLRDLKDSTGKSLLIREDILPLVQQMVGAHDIALERGYSRSFLGRAEGLNHATVSWLMQNPLFHLVTTAGKATAYAVPSTSRSSLLNYFGSAGEAIGDRSVFNDMVQHGLQPFPVRAKMEPTGAEAGAFERTMKSLGFERPYEAYQWMHRRVLADSVNKIQVAFYQMRLEQLVKQAQGRGETLTPENMDVLKTTAAQESNPIGGNLPKEEMNRTLYRALGVGLFSRGLQASTVRMLTRTIENNEIVRSVAKSKGYTEREAQIITDRNRNFLMAGLALDYAVMQVVANATNYATTAMYDEPDKDGKAGGHFVWQNPGSTKQSMLFPNSIFLYPKTDDVGNRTGEGVYVSNPVRTMRDIIEYAMIPFQIGGGEKPQVLYNKFSPEANFAKGMLSGSDWAGRPLSGPGDVAAETASMAMPAPMGDLPRYAVEAARGDNFSYLTEGVKKMFEPEMAIPVLLGMQPRVSSDDPTTTQQANEQSAEERKFWARVSRVKNLSKRIDPDVRDQQIQSVIEDARKLHMSPRDIAQINRTMRTEGVSKGQRSAAARDRARTADEGQLEAPPQ